MKEWYLPGWDVVSYLNQKLTGQAIKDEIIERVKAYRKYGRYFRIDPLASLQCNKID